MSEEQKTVNFHATHHASDSEMGVQAVRVAGLDHLSKKLHKHVTISTGHDVKPARSLDLLAQAQGDRVRIPRKNKHGKLKRGHLPLTGRIEIRKRWGA
jgi:hypothetical protein